MSEALLVTYRPMTEEQEKWYVAEHLPLAGREIGGLVTGVFTGKNPQGERFALLVLPSTLSMEDFLKGERMGKVLADVAAHLPEGSYMANPFVLD